MLSTKFKCIFVHIPKTGGQSIEHVFLKLHNLSWEERAPLLLRHNPNPELGPERLAHLKAEEYIKCNYISENEFVEYFKFAFVRNPWARLVSEYHYKKYDQKYTFREFVLNGLPKESSYRDSYRHIEPQYNFVHDSNGKLIVNFIGKFENFQSDFQQVCYRLGFQNIELPHVNKSSYKKSIDYREYYDNETMEIVENIYEKDIETFNYVFESV